MLRPLRDLQARARGGPVRSGQLYLTGERGPELYAPDANGMLGAAPSQTSQSGQGMSLGALARTLMAPVRALAAPFQPLTDAIDELTRTLKPLVDMSVAGQGGTVGGLLGLAGVRQAIATGNIMLSGVAETARSSGLGELARQSAANPALFPGLLAAMPGAAAARSGQVSGAAGEILDTLRRSGFSDAQSFALLGHMQQESNFDPKAWNARESAGGLLQWRGNRLANLQAFAKTRGTDWQDRRTQAAFVAHEMETDPYERERSARFRSARTVEAASAALREYVRFGDNSDAARLGNAKRLEREAATNRRVEQQRAAEGGGELAPLSYSNQGATRNRPLAPPLERAIREGIAKVYGEGYRAEVYSGGQPAKGSGGRRTGSTRHDDHGHGGEAADVYVIGPDGKRVSGEELAKLGQHWLATKQGGVGLEMRGGGIHLDQHRERAPTWNYASEGGQYTPEQRRRIEAGLRGEAPEYAQRSPRERGRTPAGLAELMRPQITSPKLKFEPTEAFEPAMRSEPRFHRAEAPTAQRVDIGKGEMVMKVQLDPALQLAGMNVRQPENMVANVGIDRTGAKGFKPGASPRGTA